MRAARSNLGNKHTVLAVIANEAKQSQHKTKPPCRHCERSEAICNSPVPKRAYVYILTNRNHNVLYVGVTSNLKGRVYQHRHGLISGFTSKYKIKKLVCFEVFDDMEYALRREKQIKAGSRQKKLQLIEEFNPQWRDLYDEI